MPPDLKESNKGQLGATADFPQPSELPATESLKDCVARTLPFWCVRRFAQPKGVPDPNHSQSQHLDSNPPSKVHHRTYTSVLASIAYLSSSIVQLCYGSAYRRLTCRHDVIAPAISRGERVLVSAHGNSIRGIVKHLDNLSDEVRVCVDTERGRELKRSRRRSDL